jgi:hypothetical protein
MRGEILATDVGLDLDDPSRPPAGLVVANEGRSEERASSLERGLGEEGPIQDAAADQRR